MCAPSLFRLHMDGREYDSITYSVHCSSFSLLPLLCSFSLFPLESWLFSLDDLSPRPDEVDARTAIIIFKNVILISLFCKSIHPSPFNNCKNEISSIIQFPTGRIHWLFPAPCLDFSSLIPCFFLIDDLFIWQQQFHEWSMLPYCPLPLLPVWWIITVYDFIPLIAGHWIEWCYWWTLSSFRVFHVYTIVMLVRKLPIGVNRSFAREIQRIWRDYQQHLFIGKRTLRVRKAVMSMAYCTRKYGNIVMRTSW